MLLQRPPPLPHTLQLHLHQLRQLRRRAPRAVLQRPLHRSAQHDKRAVQRLRPGALRVGACREGRVVGRRPGREGVQAFVVAEHAQGTDVRVQDRGVGNMRRDVGALVGGLVGVHVCGDEGVEDGAEEARGSGEDVLGVGFGEGAWGEGLLGGEADAGAEEAELFVVRVEFDGVHGVEERLDDGVLGHDVAGLLAAVLFWNEAVEEEYFHVGGPGWAIARLHMHQ